MKSHAYSYLRMSTDLQLKGDSRRRQLEASRAYAEANGLELAEGAELEDIGISAFKGDNVREGALGKFLEAIRSGKVKPGSYLIVESLDRLSRQQVLAAQGLFLSIVQSGINLVTLTDAKVYKAGEVDLADLIMSLVIMSRAHEESATKSRRIAAAWKNKRTQAAAVRKPMTEWCPAWLRLLPDRSGYEEIPQRVEIIRQIFNDTAEGVGMYSIASRLNKTNVATFGDSNGWHQSYLAKILANRAVLGEFQPHIRLDGKRVPHGDPVQDYYPVIIDEELFYRAQLGKAQRLNHGRGRKGAAFTNLFSGLLKCDYCDSAVLFENKGTGAKGGTYLICDGAKRKRECPSIRWRYQDFEASFLAFVEEIDIESVVNERAHQEELGKLDRELAALNGELLSVNDLMEKTYALLAHGGAVAFVSAKLGELDARKKELSEQINVTSQERQEILSRAQRYRGSKEEIRQLVAKLQGPNDDDLFKLRAQIASQLKVLIDGVWVGSLGVKPRLLAAIERLQGDGPRRAKEIAHMVRAAHLPDQSHRYFAVRFHDGSVRGVYPSDSDPLRLRQQIVATESLGFQVSDS